jgi:hypothetical protein
MMLGRGREIGQESLERWCRSRRELDLKLEGAGGLGEVRVLGLRAVSAVGGGGGGGSPSREVGRTTSAMSSTRRCGIVGTVVVSLRLGARNMY